MSTWNVPFKGYWDPCHFTLLEARPPVVLAVGITQELLEGSVIMEKQIGTTRTPSMPRQRSAGSEEVPWPPVYELAPTQAVDHGDKSRQHCNDTLPSHCTGPISFETPGSIFVAEGGSASQQIHPRLSSIPDAYRPITPLESPTFEDSVFDENVPPFISYIAEMVDEPTGYDIPPPCYRGKREPFGVLLESLADFSVLPHQIAGESHTESSHVNVGQKAERLNDSGSTGSSVASEVKGWARLHLKSPRALDIGLINESFQIDRDEALQAGITLTDDLSPVQGWGYKLANIAHVQSSELHAPQPLRPLTLQYEAGMPLTPQRAMLLALLNNEAPAVGTV